MPSPFLAAARVGWATLAVSLWLGVLWPASSNTLPDGMWTPVLALELVEHRADVEALFAVGSAERAHMAEAFARGLLVDFAFLALFATFVILFARAVAPRRDHVLARVASAAMLVEATADALENLRLHVIVGALDGAYEHELSALPWFVWLKWFALAVAFGCLAPLVARFGALGRVAALLFASVVVTVPLGFVLRGAFAEAMLLAVSVSFVSAFVLSNRERRRAPA